jgi:hypothetical protein
MLSHDICSSLQLLRDREQFARIKDRLCVVRVVSVQATARHHEEACLTPDTTLLYYQHPSVPLLYPPVSCI